jgi:hypothetical protein
VANRNPAGGLQIGLGLISFSILILALFITVGGWFVNDVGARFLIIGIGVVLVAVLWVIAVRNGRIEKAARLRLQAQHPGSLVERVKLWMLPEGRPQRDTPMHFVIADAGDIVFETIDSTALLRIPVAEIGFVGLVRAQGDTTRDRAVTIIYGDEQHTVQFFTITNASLDKLEARIRKAIGWPATGAPADAP